MAGTSWGDPYCTRFFAGILVLGIGMGITVAPLPARVMGAVDPSQSGVASGVNNAVSRAGGLLAVAALGVVLLARFNDTLDERIAAMSLPESARAAVDAQRSKLGGADFSGSVDVALGRELREPFDAPYVARSRTL